MSDLALVLRSLRSRAFSTITTALTVGVAVALLLVLLSVRSAGRQAFQRGTGNQHLFVSAESSPLASILNGLFYANPPQRALAWSKIEEIRKQFPWEWAIPTQMGDSYRGYPTLATERTFFERFEPVAGEPWRLADGRVLGERPAPGEPFEVVVGSEAARGAGLKLGDRLFLTHGSGSSREGEGHGHVHQEYPFKVVGILAPTGSPHDRALFIDLEASWILHAHDRHEREHADEDDHDHADEHAHDEDHDHADEHAHDDDHDHDHDHDHGHAALTAKDLTDADRLVTGLMLRLPTRAGRDASAAMQQQFDALRRDTTIMVASPADQIGKLMVIVGNVDGLFIAMGAVVLVSSGIAIMLALTNSMAGRRRQIAVLRVLGYSRARLFGLVMTESALLGVLGAAAGVALGFGGTLAAAAFVKARLGLVIQPTLDPSAILLIAAGAVLLGIAAGIVPAMMAYRTPVARNLRPMA